MTPRAAHVSVIDPIGPAIERVRTVLFRPFDLGKWFVIGFSAWLANLGRGQGGGGGGRGGGGGPPNVRDIPTAAQRGIDCARDFVTGNLSWIIPVGVLVAVLIVVITLVTAMRVTCGCACCFLALPFIGTVVILPVLVFLRAYSLYYLEQYGPEFRVIAPELQTTVPIDPFPT